MSFTWALLRYKMTDVFIVLGNVKGNKETNLDRSFLKRKHSVLELDYLKYITGLLGSFDGCTQASNDFGCQC